MSKIQKSWIFVELLDWIELKKSNPIIQQKSNKKSKNPTFLDF
jgi:hypothetical protein